jgi:hypothetical protein
MTTTIRLHGAVAIVAFLGMSSAMCSSGTHSSGPAAGTGGAAGTAGGGSGGSAGQSSSGGAPGTGGGGTDMPSHDEICSDYCTKVAACRGATADTCVTNCLATSQVFHGDCEQKQYAEFNCVRTLDCAGMKAYADDKLSNPTCGVVYADFGKSCLRNEGVPPAECLAYCETAHNCLPDRVVAPPGCSQSCNEAITGFEIGGGKSCGDTMQQAFGCFGMLECPDIQALILNQLTPAACAQYDSQLRTSCTPQ